uniref:Uncharacterized protein n=1 Tax=Tanacetum cinerariifolium TaxID=118510 RepID=A0A699H7Q7_TANCI|nr:hypothetical protein [Tanacetum cinerariifolium]
MSCITILVARVVEVLLLAWDRVSKIKDAFGNKKYKPDDIQELFRKLFNDVQNIHEELAEYINTPSWNRPAFYNNDDEDDDEEYTIVITPVLPTVELDNSLSMRDEYLSTIPEKEYNDDPLYSEDIDYVDELPFDSELVSFKEIEALKDNPTTSSDFATKSPSTFINSFLEETDTSDNSLPEYEIFCFDLEEKRSGNPSSHFDLSLPDYEAFFCDSKPDSEDFTMDVVEDIFDNPIREPRVHVPNVLSTHPTLHLDLDFTLSSDSLRSDLVVSFPSETRNKIFNPGIFIGVQSKRFLSPDEFSILFIRDPPFPVIHTLLLFSSENEDKVVNPVFLLQMRRNLLISYIIEALKLSIFFLKAR